MNHLSFRSYSPIIMLALCASFAGGCARPEADDPAPNMKLAEKIRLSFAEEGGEQAEANQAESQGTGWATLRGTFVFDGSAPARKPLNVTKDQSFCAPGGKVPPQETLLVDDGTKGIANVVIYLREASRTHDLAQPNEDTVPYDQKVCVYLSHVFPVMVGQTMKIMNSDPGAHNTSIQIQPSFNQTIPAGSSTTYKVVKRTAKPVAVTCGIHPWMKGYLLARKNAYMAVTKLDGTFEIPNLPAGEELEFQVWHESTNNSSGFLHLKTPEGKELGWTSKGRFTIKLEEDSTKELKLTVPANTFKS